MAYTDEELREMLLSANRELYRLTESLCYMKAPTVLIHNILHTKSLNDVEEDVLNRLDRYKRVSAVLSYLEDIGGKITHKGNLYFFNEDEGVSWGTIEELLSDDTIYDGEAFVLTVEEIVPKLLKPLLDECIENKNRDAIYQLSQSINYVFNHMLEDSKDE
jgi:hypothetical protein|nr:MAG TPA: hypothetical protein [Caudoviricetes sp.]